MVPNSNDASKQPRVLILVDYYLPGQRAGGPVWSLANLVSILGQELQFLLITRDRDLGGSQAYDNVPKRQWIQVGKASVIYLKTDPLLVFRLIRVLRETDFDVLYLNSYFSPVFSIVPIVCMRLGLIPHRPVVLAPRGQFSPGALHLKRWKKSLFRWVSWDLSLYRGVVWQATTVAEEATIKKAMRSESEDVLVTSVACDLCLIPEEASAEKAGHSSGVGPLLRADCITPRRIREKRSGSLRLAFVSRISRMKNLDFALALLKPLEGDITLDIFGPIEDKEFWEKCLTVISSLPSNIKVAYKGQLAHHEVIPTLARYHALILPTRGENFGHIILESLLAGCIVIISDQTPWRNLVVEGVGWDIPLANREEFIAALKTCVAMDDTRFTEMSRTAKCFGVAFCQNPVVIEQNRQLFRHALRVDTINRAEKPVPPVPSNHKAASFH